MQILNPTPQAVYTGVANAFSRISSTEGVSTLWRGVNKVVLGEEQAKDIYFRKVLTPLGHYVPKSHVIAGGLAGAIAAAATTPLDVAKTLLQTRGNATD